MSAQRVSRDFGVWTLEIKRLYGELVKTKRLLPNNMNYFGCGIGSFPACEVTSLYLCLVDSERPCGHSSTKLAHCGLRKDCDEISSEVLVINGQVQRSTRSTYEDYIEDLYLFSGLQGINILLLKYSESNKVK